MTDQIHGLDECPQCHTSWQGSPIPQEYIDAGYYGEGRTHFSLLVGIEYGYENPERYDGVSEWMCPACKTRWGRWTNRILLENENEKRFGGK